MTMSTKDTKVMFPIKTKAKNDSIAIKIFNLIDLQARKVMTNTTSMKIITTRKEERKVATKKDMRRKAKLIDSHSLLKIEMPVLNSYHYKLTPILLFDTYLFDFIHICLLFRELCNFQNT